MIKVGRDFDESAFARVVALLDPAQLAMLLDGIDLNARRLARWTPERDEGIDTDRRL